MKMLHVGFWTAVLVAGGLSLAADAPGGDVSATTSVHPVKIKAEALKVTGGSPLSQRALVLKPAEVNGLITWTVESRRHRGYVYCCAFNPDGKLVATGGIDGMIRIWDTASGKLVRILVGHDSYVQGLSWSPCGKALAAAGSWDGTVRIWNPQSGRLLRTFKGFVTPVQHVAWAPDGTRLVAGGGPSGWTWEWDLEHDATTQRLALGQYISILTWSPDGKFIAATAGQAAPTIIDTQTWKRQRILGTGEEGFSMVAFSHNGKQIAAGSTSAVHVWDFEAEEPRVKLAVPGTMLAWAPDDACLAAGYSGLVQLFDMPSGKPRPDKITLGNTLLRMAWHPASRQLHCLTYFNLDGWQLVDGKPKRLLDITLGGSQPPLWLERRPMITGLGGLRLSLWDGLSAKAQRKCEGHTAAINAAAWSRDGRFVASAGSDKAVKIWDAKSGGLQKSLDGHTSGVLAVAWSPDGKCLASAGTDKTVRLWDSGGGALATLEGHSAAVRVLAWSPLGNALASGSDDERVLIWDRNAKRQTRAIKAGRPVYSLAWTMMGKTAVLACGTTGEALQLLNASTGQGLLVLRQGGSPPTVTGLAWLPSGNALFSGRGNHSCQLWDVSTNKVVHNLQAMAPVQYVTLAGNGSVLVAGSLDRTVRFWDAADAELRGVILNENDVPVMLSADGHWKTDNDKNCELAYVAQLEEGQLTLSPDEFATTFHWKNNPQHVKLGGK